MPQQRESKEVIPKSCMLSSFKTFTSCKALHVLEIPINPQRRVFEAKDMNKDSAAVGC